MNTKHFLSLLFLAAPLTYSSTVMCMLSSGTTTSNLQDIQEDETPIDIDTFIIMLSQAIMDGSFELVNQCVSAATRLEITEELRDILTPVLDQVIEGKTPLNDEQKYLTLAAFASFYAFGPGERAYRVKGMPYYEKMNTAITVFKLQAHEPTPSVGKVAVAPHRAQPQAPVHQRPAIQANTPAPASSVSSSSRMDTPVENNLELNIKQAIERKDVSRLMALLDHCKNDEQRLSIITVLNDL